jgi:hypothetical protein
MTDRLGGKVILFDSLARPWYAVGGIGDGPGEFRFPSDAAALPDSLLGVVDPAKMQVTVMSPRGEYLYSFHTPRFAGRRLAASPRDEIIVGGLNDVGGSFSLLGFYDRQGRFLRFAVEAPPLLRELTPRVDDVVLGVTSGGVTVVGSAALPVLWVVSGQEVVEVSLAPPKGSWRQLMPLSTPPQTLQEARNWADAASLITGGGLMNDSIFALGWHTGHGEGGEDHLAFIRFSRSSGVLVNGAPGWLLGVDGAEIWLLVHQDVDSNLIEKFRCQEALSTP